MPANRVQLSEAELRIVADFMAAGGGVFATGDHGLLGSRIIAGNVARVNKMRRWFDLGISNNVPSATDYDRIDTIVPVRSAGGVPEVLFADQSDDTPKRLRLRRYPLWDGPFAFTARSRAFGRWAPHPIMCTPLGPLATLPDHMHEGLVREDTEVLLDSIDQAGRPEFPGGAHRPTPEVIAWSQVFGGDVDYRDAGVSPLVHRTEPTVSAYDGQQAGLGRVVVDSTWHNWLDINVRGVGADPRPDPTTGTYAPPTGLLGPHLELVHDYVRNIAQWLATGEQRTWMREGFFLHLIANTSGWSQVVNIGELIGEQAANVLGSATSACTMTGLIYEPWWFEEPARGPAGEPRFGGRTSGARLPGTTRARRDDGGRLRTRPRAPAALASERIARRGYARALRTHRETLSGGTRRRRAGARGVVATRSRT